MQIVEDDAITAFDLKEILIANHFEIVGISKTYEDALELFRASQPEILLTDIGLRSAKDGIDLIQEIQSSGNFCPVVYLSGNSDQETKSRAFKTEPTAYLTKPFNISTVIASLELAIDQFNKRTTPVNSKKDIDIFVKKGDKFFKFNPKDILYLIAEGSYTSIITANGKFLISGNLKSFRKKLSSKFIRTHRSFLVNKDKITSFDAHNVYIDALPISIGRKHKEEVRTLLQDFE